MCVAFGSSQVAHGMCEVPSMKVLTRGRMKERSKESDDDLSSGPPIPCYAGHRPLEKTCRAVLEFACSRRCLLVCVCVNCS
mmetsp:Transcript_62271/g.111652  ORF Transcript_62271/g.111652 Transcript_62271/m.111652 type:complete len:81 (+) Transcript_62271:2-244(+)